MTDATRLETPAQPAPAEDAKKLRNAATVLVLRDAPAGMEVLMLQRPERAGDRFSGAYVFPGGVIDSNDRNLHALCTGLDDRAASARLGLNIHGLDYFVAAIRESFEEAGLLFAYGPDGSMVSLESLGGAELVSLRSSIWEGKSNLGEICEKFALKLAADRLAYHSHWITPLGVGKRFDTRFFLALAPAAQTALHDGNETVHHYWLRPSDALFRAQELKLRTATRSTLESLSSFTSAQACFEHALALRNIRVNMARVTRDANGPRTVMSDHPAYAEIARIDPDGLGHASCEIEPGVAVRLSDRVIRVTAPNGDAMTGPGSNGYNTYNTYNTYLVGGGAHNEWAVIDPDSDSPAHVSCIIAAAPGPIRWIFVTRPRKEHSPAAVELKSLTGARVYGQLAPDQVLSGGERIAIGAQATLRVVHTPGHGANHLCYLLEEEQTLFTGDDPMRGSSGVISPPDSDMAEHLASLRRLLQEDLAWLAPGHGHLIG